MVNLSFPLWLGASLTQQWNEAPLTPSNRHKHLRQIFLQLVKPSPAHFAKTLHSTANNQHILFKAAVACSAPPSWTAISHQRRPFLPLKKKSLLPAKFPAVIFQNKTFSLKLTAAGMRLDGRECAFFR